MLYAAMATGVDLLQARVRVVVARDRGRGCVVLDVGVVQDPGVPRAGATEATTKATLAGHSI